MDSRTGFKVQKDWTPHSEHWNDLLSSRHKLQLPIPMQGTAQDTAFIILQTCSESLWLLSSSFKAELEGLLMTFYILPSPFRPRMPLPTSPCPFSQGSIVTDHPLFWYILAAFHRLFSFGSWVGVPITKSKANLRGFLLAFFQWRFTIPKPSLGFISPGEVRV